ncbi:MAG: transglutaminase N-terminal domain-containing protein [Phycisphaerae bacterium]
MLLHVEHRIELTYSAAVHLEPLTVRLRPRSDDAQQLVHFEMQVQPAPAGTCQALDAEANVVDLLWFSDPVESLQLHVNSRTRTTRRNPWDFILPHAEGLKLPIEYRPHIAARLGPYCRNDNLDPSVARLAETLGDKTGHKTLDFLRHLADTIEPFEKQVRRLGDPWLAAKTLASRAGTCRDTAVLFIEVCRCVGLAARFVSGYCPSDVADTTELHAWAEVFLPGLGWRGFDPGLGLAVAENHVALAGGINPAAAAPTEGTYRGTGVSSHLQYHIEMSVG